MKRCPKCGKSFADEANFCPTDAARLVAVATDAAPAAAVPSDLVAGRFQLGPVIGGQATGEVYRSTDTQGGGAVAVKLVAPAVLAIPQVAQRIDRELKQLERVQHKGIARVIASGKHADREFVATELVEGARPLGELVAASGPIDAQRASELVIAIGEALIDAAKVGVVHRDLAPKNILVTQDAIKLINFAVPTPNNGKVAGVPEFASPEAFDSKPVDQRSNIFSLGAIYYFLLTGQPPEAGEPPSKHAAVPADLDSLIMRALEKNAAKRFLTLRQFLDDVERVARGPDGGVGSTAPFGRANATKKELSQTLMGFGALGGGAALKEALAAKTRAMDVQVPPEALRDDARVVSPQEAARGPDTFAPAAAAMQQAAPAMGEAAAGSPFARPTNDPFAPAAAAMAQAAPQVGAVAVAAPAVAHQHAPQAAPQAPPQPAAPKVAGGKQKKPEEKKDKSSKGKFRETMWFKKGELDAQAAEEAAVTGDANKADKADSLPIEERYGDDGSITRGDAEKYSLRTGATSTMKAMRDTGQSPSASVSERELVGEMKSGRKVILIVILVIALLAVGLIAAFVL